MLPSPSELSYFIEVAHTLNISRASERLGISQPTLSLAIQRLERSIGTPLLLRGKSGVQLTKAGQKLSLHARELMQGWERLRAESLKEETELTGHYTLGCHASVGVYALPKCLEPLMRQYPQLNFRLVHDLSRKITEEVVSFKVDFGIVVNPLEHPDLIIRELCQDVVTLWAKPALDKRHQSVLISEPDLLQTQAIVKQLEKKGLHFGRNITSSSLEVITSLTAAGVGVGVLPSRVATHYKSLNLKPFGTDAPEFKDRICLIYRADTQKSASSKRIAREIEVQLKQAWSA